MKRYWLTVSLLLLAIGGPIYYYGFGQNNQLPKFKLESLEGDQHEAQGITLEGSYRTNVYYALRMDARGSEYSFERESSLQLLNGSRYWLLQQPDLRSLVQEHRSFMRGKTSPTGFYADKQIVAYAEMFQIYDKRTSRINSEFYVQILDKGTEKITTYKQQVPETDGNSSIYVEDVQYIDDQLMIVVNIWNGSNYKAIYALTLPEGQLSLIRKIGERQPTVEHAVVQTQLRSTDMISEPGIFVLMETSENPNVHGSVQDQEKTLELWDYKKQFMFYSYASNELIELPQELVKLRAYGSGVDSLQGSTYYYAQLDGGNVKLSQYAIEKRQAEINYLAITKEQLEAEEFIRAKINGDRVYLLMRGKGQYELAVLSLADGQLLYRGKAVQSGKNAVSEELFDLQFELHNISLSHMSL